MSGAMSQPSLDLDDGFENTFTVREFSEAVNQVLRKGFGPEGAWIRGEIQGMSSRSGHLYFNLAERTDEGQASLAVACFANTMMRVVRPALSKHRIRLDNGLSIRIHGQPNLYAPSGKFSLVMDGIDVRFTLGALAADRDRLMRRLLSEGLLDRNGRLPIPDPPLTIGVVTSVGTAAWHDFHHELELSGLRFVLRVCDTRVQGTGVAEYVAAAIATLGALGVDVIVVIRGGGSRGDLATFDDEQIARAIAGSPVPVFTGLGHEIDRSVADEVAHTAFKTPTAVAGALVERVRLHAGNLEGVWMSIAARATQLVSGHERRLAQLASGVASRTTAGLNLSSVRLGNATQRVTRQATQALNIDTAGLRTAADRLGRSAPRMLATFDRDLDALAGRVAALDPVQTLARGWSITRTSNGSLVRSLGSVSPGDHLHTTVLDGTIVSEVQP